MFDETLIIIEAALRIHNVHYITSPYFSVSLNNISIKIKKYVMCCTRITF